MTQSFLNWFLELRSRARAQGIEIEQLTRQEVYEYA